MPRVPLAERFWAKVDTTGDCWQWTGARFRRYLRSGPGPLSYGMIVYKGRLEPAHRISWLLANGPIPDGMWVLHHCDNPACVRPSHLYVGTHADNTRDAVTRRRMMSGRQLACAKLTEAQVHQIRAMAGNGVPTEQIGPKFGVSGRTIRYVMRGEHWKYV